MIVFENIKEINPLHQRTWQRSAKWLCERYDELDICKNASICNSNSTMIMEYRRYSNDIHIEGLMIKYENILYTIQSPITINLGHLSSMIDYRMRAMY